MIRKILSTTLSRFLGALISLVIVVLNSRELGPEGVARIGLVVLNISIINLLSGYFGGAGLTFFTSRTSLKNLLKYIFFSPLTGPFLFAFVYMLLPFDVQYSVLLKQNDLFFVLCISVLLNLSGNILSVVLGKEKIFLHNFLTLTQFLSLLIILLYGLYGLKNNEPETYFYSFAISWFIVFCIGIIWLFFQLRNSINGEKLSKISFSVIFSYSFWTQSASLLQIFNYRLPYYFIQAWVGNTGLGIFTNSNQIAEGLWIPSKSIALVQYSKIANDRNFESNVSLTKKLLIFTVVLTLVLSIILVSVPNSFYVLLFKHVEFLKIKEVLFYLIPGIIFMVITTITNHFFSGIGKPELNFKISLISLIVLVIFSAFLIKKYGLIGASVSMSMGYFVGAIVSLIYFYKIITNFNLRK